MAICFLLIPPLTVTCEPPCTLACTHLARSFSLRAAIQRCGSSLHSQGMTSTAPSETALTDRTVFAPLHIWLRVSLACVSRSETGGLIFIDFKEKF